MAGSVLSLAMVSGTATVINTIYAVKKGENAVTPLLAGGVEYVALTVVGGLTGRYDVATALAWLFLVAAVINHLGPLIETTDKVVKSTQKKKR